MSSQSTPKVPGYDVQSPLGEGATATVWRARRQVDDLDVALKVVRPSGGDVGAALAEAGLLAGVRHPHVVHLYDVLPVPDLTTGRPDAVVLVTRLAAGGSLSQLLGRRGMLSPGETVTVLQPVAGALADLHHLGVVHGDLSTGNLLFREDGMPLLADLGTARVAGEPPLRGAGTGGAQGLVAPEVLEGFPATRESDVYQVGALAWLCLVGEAPGPGFDRLPFAEVAPTLPPPLVDLVTRCMAPEPEDRPDAEEVAVALLAAATPEPVEVAPDADPAHGLTERLRQVAQQDARDRPEPQRRGVRSRVRRTVSRREEEGDRSTTPGHRPRHRRERQRPAGPDTGRSLVARPVPGWVAGMALFVGAAVVGALVLAAAWPPARVVLGLADAPPRHAEVATLAPTAVPAATRSPPSSTPGPSSPAPSPTPTPEPSSTPTLSAEDRPSVHGLAARVQDLVDARARAWEATDPGLLTEVVAAGSPAHEDETVELERAQDARIGYPHVAFRVEDLVVTEEDPARMSVEATVVREPLEARDDTGWLLRSPARSERVALELVLQDGRWLMWSWAPAS